jgi:hypothetical protein
MTAASERPPVTGLSLMLYARPLHPELFDTLVVRRVRHEDYDLTVCITRTGHVISWQNARGHFTEVTAAAGQELPARHRLLSHPLRGEHTERLTSVGGVSYQSSTTVETLPPEVFRHAHDEIAADGLRRGLFHNFRPRHRLALAPLGLVTTDAWSGCLVLATFHTFPAERVVVKTQTLIEKQR